MKTTIRSDTLHLVLKVLYVYFGKIYTETADISKNEDSEFGTWPPYIIMNYKITVKYVFWMKYPFPYA